MRSYHLTPAASDDLVAISDFIEQDDPVLAFRTIDGIETRCQAIAQFPEMGRTREELAPGLRSTKVGKYLIFYRPAAKRIEVIRVIHSSRDLPRLFGQED